MGVSPILMSRKSGKSRPGSLNRNHSVLSEKTLTGLAAQAQVLAVLEPPAPAAQSLSVASGVDAPLSTCAHAFDRGAQASAQTVACGGTTLPQQE
jgi:hypothetical protein